ncbi:exo-alpha-sialidase [Fulvivirga sp. M361]|uniref:WD40/YVTN/BNR-like repeat-containing protein n=1 Tax=Fulvivirga sp. M361 TaxID=2594266 RepID=UPI001179BCD1|nr:sialidase family protein [Fulvivirga sp. M361]TRX58213.1 exo-alpha-sialidase [Fulvivirga sp. M361]
MMAFSKYTFLFLAILCAFSCDDDEPEPDNLGSKAIIIGDHIYTIIQGDEQSGVFGQALDEVIKIRITDLTGRVVRRNLKFEASDNGVFTHVNHYNSDTISISWQLGCTEPNQTLKITDNVCGLAKNGCIDVEVFEITAEAKKIQQGWFQSCETFGSYSNNSVISNDKYISVITYQSVYTTTDPVNGEWTTNSSPQTSNYREIAYAENGHMYAKSRYGNGLSISNNYGQSWKSISLPNNWGNHDMIIMKNGDYIYAREYSHLIYRSTDAGASWQEFVNVLDETNSTSSQVLAIASDDDVLHIVTRNANHVITIQGQTIHVKAYTNSWPIYSDMSRFHAQAGKNNVILLDNRNYKVYGINTNSGSITSSSLQYQHSLVKSQGKVYVTDNSNTYRVYENGSFQIKSFEMPKNSSRISRLNFHQGSPVFIDHFGKLNVYIK